MDKLSGNGWASSAADNRFYRSTADYTRRAYLTTLELNHFDWQKVSSLSLAPDSSESSKETHTLAKLLPSPDFVASLLTQLDKCHALAIRVWTENPYLPAHELDKNAASVTMGQWWVRYYQLEWEISKAENLTETLKTEANKTFNEAEKRLSDPASSVNMRYMSEFQRVRATYIDKLEQITLYLEQAREASWDLRCQMLSSPPGN
ncbi:MAG: hypothetical protein FJ013_02805 [Chloroflexi bacterium]|nr:hypothetical protein [Chloroflexota bacterium]